MAQIGSGARQRSLALWPASRHEGAGSIADHDAKQYRKRHLRTSSPASRVGVELLHAATDTVNCFSPPSPYRGHGHPLVMSPEPNLFTGAR
jgi:hypothetical protein